jgi:hypothetical protein
MGNPAIDFQLSVGSFSARRVEVQVRGRPLGGMRQIQLLRKTSMNREALNPLPVFAT